MGIEYFYQFFDRGVVDPLLSLTWAEYTSRYAPGEGRREYARAKADVGGYTAELLAVDPRWADAGRIIAFALDGVDLPEDPDPALLRPYKKWTLRRTMRHSSPQFWFLAEVVYAIPDVDDLCPAIWPNDWEEEAVLVAAVSDGFLKGWISARTLWCVCELMGRPWEWLRLTSKEIGCLDEALAGQPPGQAPFPWQSPDDTGGDGVLWLGVADTRLFLRFLEVACAEDWPAPRLRSEVRSSLSIERGVVPRVRAFDLPTALDLGAPSAREKPFVVRHLA